MPDIQTTMPFEQSLALSEAMCARVCHDLAGPLGALAGTLELALAGDGEAAGLAMEIASLLSARLTLLRTAWGGGGAQPQAAAESLRPGLPGAERLRVDAGGLAHAPPERLARIVPAFLLVAASGLPRGGTITLAGSEAGLSIGIAGAGAAWPETLAACAASPERCLSAPGGPRGIAVPLACLGMHRLGLRLEVTSSTAIHVGV